MAHLVTKNLLLVHLMACYLFINLLILSVSVLHRRLGSVPHIRMMFYTSLNRDTEKKSVSW